MYIHDSIYDYGAVHKEEIRRRLYQHLNPETARTAGVSIHTLQQFLHSGTVDLTDAQLSRLAVMLFGKRYEPGPRWKGAYGDKEKYAKYIEQRQALAEEQLNQ